MKVPAFSWSPTFEDGEALFQVVCDRGLEGVVAKRLHDPYRPGERLRVKQKNRNTPRFAEESARARKSRTFHQTWFGRILRMANPVPAGSDVSSGTYRCTDCGYELQVGSTTHIPPCPSCGNGEYETVRGGDSVNDPYPDR